MDSEIKPAGENQRGVLDAPDVESPCRAGWGQVTEGGPAPGRGAAGPSRPAAGPSEAPLPSRDNRGPSPARWTVASRSVEGLEPEASSKGDLAKPGGHTVPTGVRHTLHRPGPWREQCRPTQWWPSWLPGTVPSDPPVPARGLSLPLLCSVGPVYPAGDTRRPLCGPPTLGGSVVWTPQGGDAAGQVGTGRPWSRGRPPWKLPDTGLTCECTWRPRPRLSETTKVMAVLSTVAKNVLTPKTRAQSSLEREDAIWKLKGRAGGGHVAGGTAQGTPGRGAGTAMHLMTGQAHKGHVRPAGRAWHPGCPASSRDNSK